MGSGLSTTSHALLGLLVFDRQTSEEGMTGYELKQRADYTLRFYWVSPAMSQIYTELGRLSGQGLVEPIDDESGKRPTRRYRVTVAGRAALDTWLHSTEAEFPVLKHPVALRLLMGQLIDPRALADLLLNYQTGLREHRADLQAVRDMLGSNRETAFPAMVAEWGLDYYDAETRIVRRIADEIARSWIQHTDDVPHRRPRVDTPT